MLSQHRFHFETPNVIDPGERPPDRPSRPEKDFDKDDLPPTRTSSSSSISMMSSNHSGGSDFVYKPPLSRTIKLDYRLPKDDEPSNSQNDDDDNDDDDEDDDDDPEYGVPTKHNSASSFNSNKLNTTSVEQARLFAATILTETERRESRRNIYESKSRSNRTIWTGRRTAGDMAPLRRAVGLENDGLMRVSAFEQQKRKNYCHLLLLVTAAVAFILVFGAFLRSALGGRDTVKLGDVSERMRATIDTLSDHGISARQDLLRPSSPQHQAALWISDTDPESMDIPNPVDVSSRFVQRYVLALLYFAWDGANWINGLKFTTESHECSWFDTVPDESGEKFAIGVTCNDELQVKNLLIPSNNLKGTIPKEIRLLEKLDFLSLKHNELSGTIPQSMVRLSMLDYLDLKFNQLTGTVPDFLADLQLLQVLGLSKNSLEGTLPSTLSTLQHLKTVAIDDNMLTGELTPITSIPGLEYLYAADNDFGGRLDEGMLDGLNNLLEVDLSGNRFEAASIPTQFFALPKLRVLDLSDNDISGALPRNLPINNVLEYLNLRMNSIPSAIPDSIANLGALTHLDLEANALTGNIPDERIASIENLTYLFLGKNPLAGGNLPESFQSLTGLRELSLDDTKLGGKIPIWLENLTNLKLLDLRNNELTGTLDIDFSKMDELTFVLLSDNKLTGPIPESLNTLNELAVISLHHNGFIGEASGLCRAGASVQVLTTDCGEVDCDCCDSCCSGDSCYEGVIWDSLENNQGSWEEHFRRADYSFNPHILFDN